MGWYRRQGAGIVVSVRLTPRAHRDQFDGVGVLADGTSVIQARVRAVPADGAANMALVRLFAASLRTPKSAVEIVAGHTQRTKQVRIAGDADALLAKMRSLTGE